MPKFKVRGRFEAEIVVTFSAVVEVEAESQADALKQVQSLAFKGSAAKDRIVVDLNYLEEDCQQALAGVNGGGIGGKITMFEESGE
jgi:hypothetical protein